MTLIELKAFAQRAAFHAREFDVDLADEVSISEEAYYCMEQEDKEDMCGSLSSKEYTTLHTLIAINIIDKFTT